MNYKIKVKKTPWYKMIKIKKRCKKWNKKYGNRPMTVDDIIEAMKDY